MYFLILKFIFNFFYIKLGRDSYILSFFKYHILTNLLGNIPDSEYKYAGFFFQMRNLGSFFFNLFFFFWCVCLFYFK